MDKRLLADRVLVVLLAAVLAGVLVCYALLPPRDSSGSQILSRIPAPDAAGFFGATYQDSLEQALKDQFALHDAAMGLTIGARGAAKGLYNGAEGLFTGEKGLVPYGDVYRMYGSDYLTNMPYRYSEEDAAGYRRKAEEINAFAEAHPDASVFVYYCTRAEDLDWFDETEGFESFRYGEYLESLLSGSVGFGASHLRDFEEYSARRYKTDHHWNETGADWGYIEILSLLGETTASITPRGISRAEDFGGLTWAGSRYRESALPVSGIAPDSFKVNDYILPEHVSFFGDREMEPGLAADYAEGIVTRDPDFDQYLNYFGFESEIIRLAFPQSEGRLLIVGDSFSRAIRKPLASHFNTTVYVNFRLLEEVDLYDLMAEHRFDTVLFMGQQDAFSGYFMEREAGE